MSFILLPRHCHVTVHYSNSSTQRSGKQGDELVDNADTTAADTTPATTTAAAAGKHGPGDVHKVRLSRVMYCTAAAHRQLAICHSRCWCCILYRHATNAKLGHLAQERYAPALSSFRF
jgi:hypothetical protein